MYANQFEIRNMNSQYNVICYIDHNECGKYILLFIVVLTNNKFYNADTDHKIHILKFLSQIYSKS